MPMYHEVSWFSQMAEELLLHDAMLPLVIAVRHFFKHQFGSRASIENPRGWVISLSFGFFPWVFVFFPWVFENFNLRTCFFLDFWKINQNISKIFPLLKIFGNKNGIFRGNPENLFQRWVFFLSFTNLSKVDPRGWVFSLSFFAWVLFLSFSFFCGRCQKKSLF